MRCCAILLVVILSLSYAEFNRTSGLIDVPTAKILPHLGYRLGIDGSVALKDLDEDVDQNLHLSMGLFNRLEVYADIYTFDNFTAAAGFCHKLYGSGKWSFAWGIHTFSYDRDVSEVGRGDTVGWFDDMMYNYDAYEKPFELGSAFVVATYTLRKNIDVTLGFGRGRYVGYGTHSKYFNSNLYREEGGDWGIGLIAGLEMEFTRNISFIIDGDGRDINLGFGFRFLPIEFNIALTKAEWFIWTSESYKPRLAASISFMNTREKPEPGIIAGRVIGPDGSPVFAEVGFVDERFPSMMTNAESGSFKFSALEAGLYEVYARATGYESARSKIRVSSGRAVYHELTLEREAVSPGILHGKIVESNTDRPLVARVSVLDKGVFIESDSLGLFDIYDLTPGAYKLKVEAIGYETGIHPVSISPGTEHVLSIRMIKPYDVIVLKGLKFEFGKAAIKPESYPILDEAAAIITNHPDVRVEVQGHTDAIGSAESNIKLSYLRATAVRDYLIKEHDISPSRLIPMAYGENRPVASNETTQGREENRRVEFLIIE